MNCPELYLKCDELCSFRRDDRCHSIYWDKPMSIYDLMSHEELVAYIKTQLKPEPEWSRRQWGYVGQIESQVLHLQKEVHSLLKTKKEGEKYLYE